MWLTIPLALTPPVVDEYCLDPALASLLEIACYAA
jgi:hypothetical protein